MQARLTKALERIPIRRYGLDLWRNTCHEFLAGFEDEQIVTEDQLQDCEKAVSDPDDASTQVEPTLTHFLIMEQCSGGNRLMHTYGEMVEIIGSHFSAAT